ncbi:MAG: hypothetical protein KIH08_12825 [Candidatus Freyarchaeota archaeon]|nr:hypothetical protein [Candidatus Jordarchaeia archaeon]
MPKYEISFLRAGGEDKTQVKKMAEKSQPKQNAQPQNAINKRRPDITGVIQLKTREEIGRIALWNYSSKNKKAPDYKGVLKTENGNIYIVSLWRAGKVDL